jgi:hypothetical protein
LSRIRSAAAALIAFLAAAPALAQEAPAPPAAPEAAAPSDAPAPPPADVPPAPPPAFPPAPAIVPSPAAVPPAPLPPSAYAPGAPGSGFVFEPAPPYPRDTTTTTAPPREKDVSFDLGFGTEAPISVGGVATLEVPGRILFQLGLGFMPKGYGNAIDGFLTSVGAYDQTISNLVRNAFTNSFVLRASAGWRPFPGHGLEILAGYTLMTLGGSTTAADVINAVLAESGSAQRVQSAMNVDLPLSATLHNVHASLGWRWLLADDHVVVRASVSYIQCVASNVGVSLSNVGGQAAAMEGPVNTALNGFLSPYFTTYAKAPTLGLSAAYRF